MQPDTQNERQNECQLWQGQTHTYIYMRILNHISEFCVTDVFIMWWKGIL